MHSRPVPEGCLEAVRTSEGPVAQVIHRELAWEGWWWRADLVCGSPTAAGAACSRKDLAAAAAAAAIGLETIGGGVIAEQRTALMAAVLHPSVARVQCAPNRNLCVHGASARRAAARAVQRIEG